MRWAVRLRDMTDESGSGGLVVARAGREQEPETRRKSKERNS